MECHHSSENNNNSNHLDSLKLKMQHGNGHNVGSKDAKGVGGNCIDDVHGKLSQLEPGGKSNMGLYDMPLPFFGCGIGWFSFVAGFIFPPFWYYATVLYFGNYYHPKDPRERAGLAASAIAALISTVIILVLLLAVLVPRASWFALSF